MHMEQFPDTVQDIQRENTLDTMIEEDESLLKVTPRHWSILFPWLQHNRATDTLLLSAMPTRRDVLGTLVTGVARV